MALRKILYVIDTLSSGGGERQLMYILSRLDRQRFSPMLIVLHDEAGFPYYYKEEIQKLDIPLFTLHMPYPPKPAGLPAALLHYAALTWRLRPHVVQSCLHPSNLITRLARPLCWPHRLINMNQSLHTRKRMLFEWLTAFLCDRIVANSQHNSETLIQHGKLSPRRVSYINCGVDYERFLVPPPNTAAPLFPDADFVALMIARIDPVKEHATVLEALALLKPKLPEGFRLVFIGEIFHQPTQEQINRLIADYQLQDWVIQLPPTSDIAPYYHRADVTLLPSIREGFGLVVVESLAAGKPVIVSEAANPLRIIQPDQTGWVFPTGDAQALADALLDAIHTSPEQRHMMGMRGQQEAPKYNIETMVQQYMALYE